MGRTTKCNYLLYRANGYCQPIHQLIKIVFIWNCWICKVKWQAQSAPHLGFILFFLFSATWIAYCLVIALSSDIRFSVAMTAWIKTQNWMLRTITFLVAFLCVRYNAQISLTFRNWVTCWVKSVPSITKVLVFCRHKSSTWLEPPCWREMVTWQHWGELFHTISSQTFLSLPFRPRVQTFRYGIIVICS